MRERQRKGKDIQKEMLARASLVAQGEKGSAANAGNIGSIPAPRGGRQWQPPRTPAWRIPWAEGPASYSWRGRKESDSTERLYAHFHFLPLAITHAAEPSACASAFEPGSRAWQLQPPERRLPRALLRSQRSLHPATGGQPLAPETGAEPAEQQGPTAAKKQMSK